MRYITKSVGNAGDFALRASARARKQGVFERYEEPLNADCGANAVFAMTWCVRVALSVVRIWRVLHETKQGMRGAGSTAR